MPDSEVRDVTQDRLFEVTYGGNWAGDHVTRWTAKAAGAPLTATEQAVLGRIPADGLPLGHVSKPLLYAPIIRQTFPTKPARKALYGLLARGALRIIREYGTGHEQIVRG